MYIPRLCEGQLGISTDVLRRFHTEWPFVRELELAWVWRRGVPTDFSRQLWDVQPIAASSIRTAPQQVARGGPAAVSKLGKRVITFANQ